MKPNETIFRAKKRYVAIMVLCFLYAGFSLIMFFSQAYTSFWRAEIVDFPVNDRNFDLNRLTGPARGFERAAFFPETPVGFFTSPNAVSSLFGGVIAFMAGIMIWSLIREKEIKAIKHQTTAKFLLPDERKVIEVLRESNYESVQSRLAKETGLSKVQVHRAVKKLEAKGAVEKHGFGLTNKIILKKDFFD